MQPLTKGTLACALALGLLGAPGPLPGPGVGPNSEQLQCAVSAVYHEARGEPAKGKRAVLDVIFNRTAQRGKTVCDVVAEKHQFPWYKKKGLVELTDTNLKMYSDALAAPNVLKDKRFVYFNTVSPEGSDCKHVGNHTFCKEK